MFRPVRKKKNELSTDAAKALLHSARRGVLAVNGDDGYPYAIPINFLYDEEAQKIYFHGASVGHKVNALRVCDKTCFTVYGNESIREEDWAPFVQSTVVFGRCRGRGSIAGAAQAHGDEILPGGGTGRQSNRGFHQARADV